MLALWSFSLRRFTWHSVSLIQKLSNKNTKNWIFDGIKSCKTSVKMKNIPSKNQNITFLLERTVVKIEKSVCKNKNLYFFEDFFPSKTQMSVFLLDFFFWYIFLYEILFLQKCPKVSFWWIFVVTASVSVIFSQ